VIEAGVDTKTTFRCFPTLEALFLAAIEAMQTQVIEQLSLGASADLQPLAVSQEQLRMALWLCLSGTDPLAVNAINGGEDVRQKAYSLDLIGFPREAGDRAASAVYGLFLSFVAAQVTIAPLQTKTFAPEVLDDVALPLFTLTQKMPEIAKDLGWTSSPDHN